MIKYKEAFKERFNMPSDIRDRLFVFFDEILKQYKNLLLKRWKGQFERQQKLH